MAATFLNDLVGNFCLKEVCDSNLSTYLNLAQAYEAEFSRITKKNPNLKGLYELDTTVGGEVQAYILQDSTNTIGFAAASVPEEGTRDLREFYVVPTMRGKRIGTHLARQVFSLHPGKWTVKQLAEASHATSFWHQAFTELGIPYEETTFQDEYWGRVVMQTFQILPQSQPELGIDLENSEIPIAVEIKRKIRPVGR
jgi:predicted acetyltransferase